MTRPYTCTALWPARLPCSVLLCSEVEACVHWQGKSPLRAVGFRAGTENRAGVHKSPNVRANANCR